ncbi:FecR family protein [Zobellia uliginosa]|uniref:FecR family protein n=1 Tax=Zobellia uliginosa TaxID=143224 RepID=A0ABY1KQG2_9FLAO|nr:FecR family protein [Zobellia uliginosa]SIS47753.1 FecR family protein [Zobellia uliginosa]
MLNEGIEDIIVKYLAKSASDKEIIELTEWLKNEANLLVFEDFIRTNYVSNHHMLDFDTEFEKKKVLDVIQDGEKKRARLKRMNHFFKYAALVLVLLGLVYVYNSRSDTPTIIENGQTFSVPKNDVPPGHDKAVLTLDNGEEVVLEKEKEVKINGASQNGEKLVYDRHWSQETEASLFNYLTIPKGGQFFVQLSDGTKVWLNSDSKLKYPVKFMEGQTREVELLYGEAYFEVAKSSEGGGTNFTVKTGIQLIDVLGTQFNIKAYNGESDIVTTLVEGRIAIESGTTKEALAPLEQSIIDRDRPGAVSIRKVEKVFDEIAWKHGYFSFKRKSMEDIMTILARWYDVDYEFKDSDKKKKTFTGVLDRESTISQILINIQKTNEIRFEINERKVIIE